MRKAKQTIDILVNNYQPGEFLPIFEDGQLSNRKQFVAYKLRCVFVKRSLV